MLLPSSFPAVKQTQSTKQLYRRYLQHLRSLPDPHIWSILIPRYRHLLSTSHGPFASDECMIAIPHSESSRGALERQKEWKRNKALKRAEKDLVRLRAAVACHPHALTRLIEEVYGQRGLARHKLLQSISSKYYSKPYIDPLPPPLHPLKPLPAAPSEAQPRARKITPPCRIRTELRRSIERDWTLVRPPLYIPSLSPTHVEADQEEHTISMRIEREKMVKNLRLLSGFNPPSSILGSEQLAKLDLSSLPRRIQRLFPHKDSSMRLSEPPLLPPRPKATRQNPNIWGLPRRLDSRLLTRTYRRFWDSLVWVRPSDQGQQDKNIQWKKCSFAELTDWRAGKLAEEGKGFSEMSGHKSKRKRRLSEALPGKIDIDKWSQATDSDKQYLSTGEEKAILNWS